MTKLERMKAGIRKTIDKAFGKKESLKSKVAPTYPMSAEREFQRKLKGHVKGADNVLSDMAKKGGGGSLDTKKGASAIRRAIDKKKLKSDVKKASDSVLSISLKGTNRAARKTIGIDLNIPPYHFEKNTQNWDDRTVKAIEEYINTLADRVENATTQEQIISILSGLRRWPKRVSRLTITELNGDVSEQIQRVLGNDRYVWATARDDRVRPCHRSFDGKTFFWNDPPEIWELKEGRRVYTGRHCHPGQDYNCRCTAIMVFNKRALKKFLKLLEDEK